MLTDEQTSPEQFAALRAMTGARRLRLAERLYWSARKLKTAGLHCQHPDWPEPRVNDEVRRIFSHARNRKKSNFHLASLRYIAAQETWMKPFHSADANIF